ncbi:hydroxycarboxylic acid receptor 3-like [Brachyistius frenatus]|uniref:hydroxycarboxylic acid receptor 3-like n=1 Tax=Brachyistius frenatus TaxID=100188 RepID=UPI0037E91D8E
MKCNFNGTVLTTVLPPLLVTEFVLGLLANGLALWIFCFHLRPWKSSTVLLFNLAIADFLLNLTLPFRAAYYISKLKWIFGAAFCNIELLLFTMNRSGSTFFVMAIAVDRYMRVVHPHHPINHLSVSKAVLGALGLWLVTISMTAHVLTLQHNNTSYCESFMIDSDPGSNFTWHRFVFLFSFFIPVLVILFCTICITGELRRRQLGRHAKIKKAMHFLIIVVVVFIICFLPSNITMLMTWIKTQKLTSTLSKSEICPAFEDLNIAFFITIALTYLNSVLNPVVYYLSSPIFKGIWRKVLHLPEANTVD